MSHWRCWASCRCSSSRGMPACTVTVKSPGLWSRIRSKRAVLTTALAGCTAGPQSRRLPRPLGSQGKACRCSSRTSSCSSLGSGQITARWCHAAGKDSWRRSGRRAQRQTRGRPASPSWLQGRPSGSKSSCSTTTPPAPRRCTAARCCCAGRPRPWPLAWPIPRRCCFCWPTAAAWPPLRPPSGCGRSARRSRRR